MRLNFCRRRKMEATATVEVQPGMAKQFRVLRLQKAEKRVRP